MNRAAFVVLGMLIACPSCGDEMPAVEQNALVVKYCAVCHTDSARNGGLSLQHFNAQTAPPSLAAMMLSKLTGGLPLDLLRTMPSHPDARVLVEKRIRGGAINAAGIATPTSTLTLALAAALARRAADSDQWNLQRSDDEVWSASILRETPLTDGDVEAFRLTMSCDVNSRRPSMQLDWSPIPKLGELSVTVDNRAPVSYQLQGIETMGNGGSGKTTGRASASLSPIVPKEKLSASGLFSEPVVFPFSTMPAVMRRALEPCFSAAK